VTKITSKGKISVLTGSGVNKHEDGVGTKASFAKPCGIAIDQRNGDVYVSEFDGHTIRKIYQHGWTSCEQINEETARRKTEEILLEALGNIPLSIWVDIISMCGLISLVHLSQVCFAFYHPAKSQMQGNVITIAGNGIPGVKDGAGKDARFNNPCGLCFSEAEDSLYIADYGNQRIRKLDTKTGFVSTIAGTGETGYMDGKSDVAKFNSPADVKLAEDGRSLLVADTLNNSIRYIMLSKQGGLARVKTLAGSGQRGIAEGSTLEMPHGICFDGSHAIYISDSANNRICKLA